MGFMDKFMGSVEKAKEEVSDFAETTRLKREIGRLNDRKSELFAEVGRQVYGLYGQGRAVAEVESLCKELKDLDDEIKGKAEEITRITIES